MRTIIIGDVHGFNGSLQMLLEKTKPVPGQDRLVFLGDLFDRGPDSYEVYETVKRLADAFGEDFILLLGNHEDYLLQPSLTLRQRAVWERVGRRTTAESFRRSGGRMEDAIPWMKKHIRLYWRSDTLQCVHAGLMLDPPDVNDLYTLVHDHDIVMMNRYHGPLTITGHIALEDATWFAGDEQTTEKLAEDQSLQLPEYGVICIDTGCGKGGRLTAMITEGREYVLTSVPEQ